MDLKEESILGNRIAEHWYYVSKGRAMRRFLGDAEKIPEVLDVGAGSGIFSRQLIDTGLCDGAICLDPHYPEDRTETHGGKPIRFVRSLTKSSHKLILMMDVLEHVADDVALLKRYADNNLAPDGQVLITVPAFLFLWSGHDVFLEHHRRYTISGVEAVVRKAGLTPAKSRYFFAGLFPVIAARRWCRRVLLDRCAVKAESDLRLYPNWLNTVLTTIHDIERCTLFGFNRLLGLTVFCLCRK
jgi:hypothetical protein